MNKVEYDNLKLNTLYHAKDGKNPERRSWLIIFKEEYYSWCPLFSDKRWEKTYSKFIDKWPKDSGLNFYIPSKLEKLLYSEIIDE